MVGSAWKANIKPSDLRPPGPSSPGETAKGPNKKYIPSLANDKTLITPEFTRVNKVIPAGTRKIKKAKRSGKTSPQITMRQLIIRRFVEISQVRTSNPKIPKRLIRLDRSIFKIANPSPILSPCGRGKGDEEALIILLGKYPTRKEHYHYHKT